MAWQALLLNGILIVRRLVALLGSPPGESRLAPHGSLEVNMGRIIPEKRAEETARSAS
jgi:hypothetical protein